MRGRPLLREGPTVPRQARSRRVVHRCSDGLRAGPPMRECIRRRRLSMNGVEVKGRKVSRAPQRVRGARQLQRGVDSARHESSRRQQPFGKTITGTSQDG
jgi:hypothetical protein